MRNNNTRRFGCGTIALGAILLCAVAFLLPRILGDGNDIEPQSIPQDNPPVVNTTGDVDLGQLVVTNAIDRDGCPTDDVQTLRNQDEFFVVAPNSEVAINTDIFARLYLDNVAIEDVPIITSDRDYANTCINFLFERTDGRDFDPGNYEVEFWVNGNAYDSISFDVQ